MMSSFSDDFDDLDQLIMKARASVIAKLDAATDFDAVLADIYARAQNATTSTSRRPAKHDREADSQHGGLDVVCDHIDMLSAVLEPAIAHEIKSPEIGRMYLSEAQRSLRRLRDGLSKHHLGKGEALRLIDTAEHNIREADVVLRRESGRSLDDALQGRIEELRDLGSDIAGQILTLRGSIGRLFDEATDIAALTPLPHF